MHIEGLMDILIETSVKKESALRELLDLTIAQETLIKQGSIEEVLEKIEQKQNKIHQIQKIDITFLSSYHQMKEILQVESLEEIDVSKYPTLKNLKRIIKDITDLLKKIDELDKRNVDQMQNDFKQLKEEMKKLKAKQQGSKIASTYGNTYGQVQGVFIDHK
ncbi:flagellar export chaperone FlgN [Inediibacterium massiliense]|uniref:flagellar export chaperone FlgN n=1 Tax=Inediibacterium massiliense TaxID=1658111 RepID=UPI0006B58AEB|nr:flagellar export chaperone FlgN [Inediibacterium massiliense]